MKLIHAFFCRATRRGGAHQPVAEGLRNISLVTVLMSILTLQISVIAAFELGTSM